jgi:hypothetical protein
MITPVFVVGSPRSGTSALAESLLGAGYNGYREGNFLPLLTTLNKLVDQHFAVFGRAGPKVMVSFIDPETLRSSIARTFRDETVRLNPEEPWFDKSGNPEMIEAIPTLLQLWPEARFVFAKRRAIENVVSRMTKFPAHTFEYHCRDWVRNMFVWRRMRDRIPEGRAIEVDQQDLIRDPKSTAGRISELLDLGESQKMALAESLMRGRPQQTEEGSAQRVLTLSGLWPNSQRLEFESICGPEMKAYGYATDGRYWAAAESVAK